MEARIITWVINHFFYCKDSFHIKKVLFCQSYPILKTEPMDYFLHRLKHQLVQTFKSIEIFEGSRSVKQKILQFFEQVRAIGYTTSLEDYEKRKLRIFNQLNFFQLITGILAPAIAIISSAKFPVGDWYIAISPALISI